MDSARFGIEAFETELGWLAIAGQNKTLAWVTMGHATAPAALTAIFERAAVPNETFAIGAWFPQLRKRLIAYAAGKRDNFQDVAVDTSHLTDFQRRVIRACRKIDYGQTQSYGELALQAGTERAARAVGNAMAGNRCPLVIPCHRVVASSGLGGFSAGQGLTLKLQLLQLESKGYAKRQAR